MALEIPYLELLPKEYKKVVKILLKKLQNANQFSVKYRLLQTFIEKYTGLPEIFDYWFRETMNNQLDLRDKELKWHGGAILDRARKDFPQYERKEWPNFDKHLCKNLNRDDTTKFFLVLPHSKLSLVYQVFQEELGELDSLNINENYELACEIYEEMEACDINDGKKYIEIIKKTKNDEFININIEIRLANNPWCQNIWEAYMQYLEYDKKDYKALLSVLQRYCRLFFNDKIIKEKYYCKIKEMSHVLKGMWEFWIDAIKFELQFLSVTDAMDLLEKALEIEMYEKMKLFDAALELAEHFRLIKIVEKIEEARKAYLKEHPDADGYNFKRTIKNLSFDSSTKLQKFPFSKTINHYLKDKLDHQHLQKLYQTCKWFYYKYRYNLVHRFEVTKTSAYYFCENHGRHLTALIPVEKYSKSSITVSPYHVELKKLKSLWLTQSLFVQHERFIPQILKMATKISLKYLRIYYIHFLYSEFVLLTESKTIKKVHLNAVTITNNDDNAVVPMEDILELVPEVEYIVFHDINFLPQPEDKLLSLKFKNEIKYLELSRIGNFEINIFLKFLKKNLAPKASLCFHNLVFHDYEEVQRQINAKLAAWKPQSEKPHMSWKFSVNV